MFLSSNVVYKKNLNLFAFLQSAITLASSKEETALQTFNKSGSIVDATSGAGVTITNASPAVTVLTLATSVAFNTNDGSSRLVVNGKTSGTITVTKSPLTSVSIDIGEICCFDEVGNTLFKTTMIPIGVLEEKVSLNVEAGDTIKTNDGSELHTSTSTSLNATILNINDWFLQNISNKNICLCLYGESKYTCVKNVTPFIELNFVGNDLSRMKLSLKKENASIEML